MLQPFRTIPWPESTLPSLKRHLSSHWPFLKKLWVKILTSRMIWAKQMFLLAAAARRCVSGRKMPEATRSNLPFLSERWHERTFAFWLPRPCRPALHDKTNFALRLSFVRWSDTADNSSVCWEEVQGNIVQEVKTQKVTNYLQSEETRDVVPFFRRQVSTQRESSF